MSTAGQSKRRSASSGKKNVTRRSSPRSQPIDRPFDEATWRRAQKIASSYRLIIEPEPGVGYFGHTAELPYAMADGQTIEACVRETMEATTAVVATMLEQGEKPPSPAAAAKRDRQVNIRLTADEKLRLEDAARTAGFRSVSDYLRTAGLERAG